MTAGPARICVCVSGEGSNLRALRAAERRGLLGGTVTNVIADRPCKAVEWAVADGIETKVVAPSSFADRTAWDEGLAGAISAARPDLVVLAGFMRVVGRSVLDIAPRRILNVHPSLLPSFPGTDAVGDALAAGVRVTGVTVHIVDSTLDGGPIVLQEPVAVMSDDDRDTLHARLHAVEHRLLPRAVALMLAGAARMAERGVDIDASRAAELPVARRALLSVSDKTGIVELGTSLVELGFELLSTGGTARALRLANIPVTDVSTVTGVPEMLDGRVKTLHPQIAGALLADLRSTAHREQLAAAAIDPIELVVVNLYPFEAASRRPDITADELVEEIDIGGPTLVRAAAKNHANVTVVTDPADYDTVVKALRSPAGIGDGMRRDLAVRAFAHTATYDSTIARKLPHVLGRLAPVTEDLSPERVQLSLERVEELRYGENPHQRAALYRSLDASADEGPFANGAHLLQGKPLSYNNILDAARATALCRDLRGAAVVIVKHTNPCGAAEADDLLDAWERALAGDPVSAFGGIVAVRGTVDETLAGRLASIFLEVIVAADLDDGARVVLQARPNLRLLSAPSLLATPPAHMEWRTAGGGYLATTADVLSDADEPGAWTQATSRRPTQDEISDLDLGWRVARHVTSNAIVLVRNGAVVGVGAGQMSRVDSARLAVEKAGLERAAGAACASDAFFPFADGVELLLAAGVSSFVQPGGSVRDDDVIAAAERAGASMMLTGRRHFRH